MPSLKVSVGSLVIGKEERKAINDVLSSGRISEGKVTYEFEKKFADYIGTKYCVAVNSGTSALLTSLYTLKHLFRFGNGTKVLTHKTTFVATHNAIKAVGFKPIFKGKADIAIPVHLMGYPKYDLDARFVIEDCAQAHGSTYYGTDQKVGTRGLMGTFSFYIAHNIQAGEMGAVVTNDLDCYKTLKKIKAHGRMCDCLVCKRSEGKCPRPLEPDPRFTYDMFGLNFKTMDLVSALALCQLKKTDWIKQKRYENVKYLNERLEDLQRYLVLPNLHSNVSYLAYPLFPKKVKRAYIRQKLEDYGIESRPLFNDPTGFYLGAHQYLTRKDLDYIAKILHCILPPFSKR